MASVCSGPRASGTVSVLGKDPYGLPDSTGRTIWLLTIVGMVVGLIVIFYFIWSHLGGPGTARGHVESTGETGTWTLTEGRCYSGQLDSYYGVITWGPKGSGISIKLVKDQVRGWTAVVDEADICKPGMPDDKCIANVFSRNNCKTLQVSLHRNGTTINGVRELDGSLTMDCTESHGKAHVVGQLSFDSCH